MAPPLRRKKRVSSPTATSNSPVALAQNGRPTQIAPHHSSPTKESTQTPRSPFRRVNDGRISKVAKQALLDNLELELNERTRKLRAQYTQQSHALKQRIEMRINRIPKKLWMMTMAELLTQAEGRDMASVDRAKGFVHDIRRLSHGDAEKGKDERLMVQKKRVSRKAGVGSGRKQMAPLPLPQSSHNPLGLSSKSNLPPSSSSPVLSSSPQRSSPQRAVSPVKQVPKGTRTRRVVPNNSRPTSRATARSSTETAGTTVSAAMGMRGTKSSQAKAKAAAIAAAVNSEESRGLKRGGGMNNTGSNGSLKENRVAGVKKDAVTKAGGASRVLRSRK